MLYFVNFIQQFFLKAFIWEVDIFFFKLLFNFFFIGFGIWRLLHFAATWKGALARTIALSAGMFGNNCLINHSSNDAAFISSWKSAFLAKNTNLVSLTEPHCDPVHKMWFPLGGLSRKPGR